jgi:hypothetical protein
VTDNLLINRLAQEILQWRVAPGRFLTAGRGWVPRWKFNPLERIEDAFMLLERSGASQCVISRLGSTYRVAVERDGRLGRSNGRSIARTVTAALVDTFGWTCEQDSTAGDAR